MKYILPVVMGAIIGYVTNWLAIKMLFRPFKELKFLGMRLPFTPGVIPKERYRISKSVGETIGMHLLSADTIVEVLCSQRIKEQISPWVEQKINGLGKNKNSVSDYIKYFSKENYDRHIDEIKAQLSGVLYRLIDNNAFEERVYNTLRLQITDNLDRVYESRTYKTVKGNLLGFVYNYSKSQELEAAVYKIMAERFEALKAEEKNLKDVIPDEFTGIIKEYVNTHSSDIAAAIKEMLLDTSIQEGIRNAIGDFIEQNLGKLVTMFMKPEFLSSKIIEGIFKYIDNPGNHAGVAALVTTSIDRLLEKKGSEVIGEISPELQVKALSEVSNFVINLVNNKENQERVIDLIEGKLKSSDESIKNSIMEFARDNIDFVLKSKEVKEQMGYMINDMVDYMINLPISSVTGYLNKPLVEKLIKFTQDSADNFIKGNAESIAQLVNIPDVVEKKINDFDVEFVEKIILEISSRELSAITWFGAVLGAAIGLLTPLLESLYK